MSAINLRRGVVVRVVEETAGGQVVVVKVEGGLRQAWNCLAMGYPVQPGEEVTLNTTAEDLRLGSGGFDFVVPGRGEMSQGWGHQIKLRYTPLQLRVNCAEEQASPWHGEFALPGGLEGIVVLAAELHSMVPPLALALRRLCPGLRTVYVMTDGGALPAAFSRNVSRLRELDAIAGVVTSGHSFGGDVETLNIYTGLQAAARVLKAKAVIVAMGPGIAGTGTVFGFSGLEQGFVLNAARALGGVPVLVPRISFADRRRRHWGLSHHSRTVLRWVCSGPVWLALPLVPQPRRRLLAGQAKLGSSRVMWRDGRFIAEIAALHPDLFSTMGRSYHQDPVFFQALGSAASLAASRLV